MSGKCRTIISTYDVRLVVTGEAIPNIKTDLARLMILYVPEAGINIKL